MIKSRTILLAVLFVLCGAIAYSATPFVVSPRIGSEIDSFEREYFSLFRYARQFKSAEFFTDGDAGKILCKATYSKDPATDPKAKFIDTTFAFTPDNMKTLQFFFENYELINNAKSGFDDNFNWKAFPKEFFYIYDYSTPNRQVIQIKTKDGKEISGILVGNHYSWVSVFQCEFGSNLIYEWAKAAAKAAMVAFTDIATVRTATKTYTVDGDLAQWTIFLNDAYPMCVWPNTTPELRKASNEFSKSYFKLQPAGGSTNAGLRSIALNDRVGNTLSLNMSNFFGFFAGLKGLAKADLFADQDNNIVFVCKRNNNTDTNLILPNDMALMLSELTLNYERYYLTDKVNEVYLVVPTLEKTLLIVPHEKAVRKYSKRVKLVMKDGKVLEKLIVASNSQKTVVTDVENYDYKSWKKNCTILNSDDILTTFVTQTQEGNKEAIVKYLNWLACYGSSTKLPNHLPDEITALMQSSAENHAGSYKRGKYEGDFDVSAAIVPLTFSFVWANYDETYIQRWSDGYSSGYAKEKIDYKTNELSLGLVELSFSMRVFDEFRLGLDVNIGSDAFTPDNKDYTLSFNVKPSWALLKFSYTYFNYTYDKPYTLSPYFKLGLCSATANFAAPNPMGSDKPENDPSTITSSVSSNGLIAILGLRAASKPYYGFNAFLDASLNATTVTLKDYFKDFAQERVSEYGRHYKYVFSKPASDFETSFNMILKLSLGISYALQF